MDRSLAQIAVRRIAVGRYGADVYHTLHVSARRLREDTADSLDIDLSRLAQGTVAVRAVHNDLTTHHCTGESRGVRYVTVREIHFEPRHIRKRSYRPGQNADSCPGMTRQRLDEPAPDEPVPPRTRIVRPLKGRKSGSPEKFVHERSRCPRRRLASSKTRMDASVLSARVASPRTSRSPTRRTQPAL